MNSKQIQLVRDFLLATTDIELSSGALLFGLYGDKKFGFLTSGDCDENVHLDFRGQRSIDQFDGTDLFFKKEDGQKPVSKNSVIFFELGKGNHADKWVLAEEVLRVIPEDWSLSGKPEPQLEPAPPSESEVPAEEEVETVEGWSPNSGTVEVEIEESEFQTAAQRRLRKFKAPRRARAPKLSQVG